MIENRINVKTVNGGYQKLIPPCHKLKADEEQQREDFKKSALQLN